MGGQGDGRLQPQLPARCTSATLVNVDVREGTTPPAPGLLARGGLRRGEAGRPLAATTTSSPCARASSPSSPTSAASSSATSTSGARLFGNAGQQPLAVQRWPTSTSWRRRPTASSTPSSKREQKVFIANVFRQDFLTKGYTISAQLPPQQGRGRDVPLRRQRLPGAAGARSGTPAPPRGAVATTWAWPGDGHVGRLNLSHAFYYAFGDDEHQRGGADGEQDIRAAAGRPRGLDRQGLGPLQGLRLLRLRRRRRRSTTRPRASTPSTTTRTSRAGPSASGAARASPSPRRRSS